MKKAALIIFFLLLASTFAAAQRKVPTFNQYRVVVEKTQASGINYRRNPDARTFRTRLNHAYASGINFAGRYIVTGWGCGTGCTNAAIIDTRTGNVIWPDEFMNIDATYGDDYSERQIDYRKNSRLLIIHGRPGSRNENANPPPSGDHYYEWKNHRLHLLRSVKKN